MTASAKAGLVLAAIAIVGSFAAYLCYANGVEVYFSALGQREQAKEFMAWLTAVTATRALRKYDLPALNLFYAWYAFGGHAFLFTAVLTVLAGITAPFLTFKRSLCGNADRV